MTGRLGRLVMAVALAVLGAAADAAAAGPLEDVGALKAITCSACHGVAGNSRSDAMPIIAGLDPAYLKRQMEVYAAGKRPSPEMEPYAKEVLDLGVDDIAAYFGRPEWSRRPSASRPPQVDRGRAAAAPVRALSRPGRQGRPRQAHPEP